MIKKNVVLIFAIIHLKPIFAFSFIQFIEKGVNVAQNAGIYMDAVSDVMDSIDDTSSVNKDLSNANKKLSDLKAGLNEIKYTKEDIDEIVDSEGLDSQDLSDKLHSIAKKIRSGKNIASRILLLAAADPAAVSAGENIKSNQIQAQMLSEMTLARLDRQKERQDKVKERLTKLLQEQKSHSFMLAQFENMQKKSKSTPFANFKLIDDKKIRKIQ